jgi:hypothetical protein
VYWRGGLPRQPPGCRRLLCPLLPRSVTVTPRGHRLFFGSYRSSCSVLEDCASDYRSVQVNTIGLLGGMSWESTAIYYRLINQSHTSAARPPAFRPVAHVERRLRGNSPPAAGGTLGARGPHPRRGGAAPRERTAAGAGQLALRFTVPGALLGEAFRPRPDAARQPLPYSRTEGVLSERAGRRRSPGRRLP